MLPREEHENILDILRSVKDPEIPAVDIVELGIVREVRRVDSAYHIDITPTYSGCPAMEMIQEDICRTLENHGIKPVVLHIVLSPPWTSLGLSEETKKRLRGSGIAPPDERLHQLPSARTPAGIICPHCGSENTKRESEFGSTACKALYSCLKCSQPFDYFKPI